MEKLKKWFDFSDTVSGAAFLVRWVVAFAIQSAGGYALGFGFASSVEGVMLLGMLVATVGIVIQFSTLMKRSRALFPEAKRHYPFYFAYLIISISFSFLKSFDMVIAGFAGLVMLFMFVYLIFKNSGTAIHEG